MVNKRPTAAARGYGSRWQKARRRYLQRNPFCWHCDQEGRVTAATQVDHIVPHRGDLLLFWDQENWQPLCASCHSRKTAIEDGAFGRPPPGGVAK
jgi:5-methylcytosine-specific restriction protein A